MKCILKALAFCAAVAFLAGCAAIPRDALAMKAATLEDRRMESRKFETNDEEKVLKASAALLQDLGFSISESAPKLGVIVGYKDRSAVEGGQVASKIIIGVLFGANMPIDRNQKFKASVITKPSGENTNEIVVRVTFQRIVINEYNQISKLEQLKDPKQYEHFFNELSKSLFLTANDI